ncbi:hypothetical protein PR202_ga14615 [Eleusine coracana subsp. coracana]|uniref:Uncharacterized protein n=1 Tax=Eleusine coracana subsp. coracana TaxID=191504 RepID=A0AAV5CH25_ELECO|nr:hypothetical protein QOZ80_6BG0501930 [Eleusine coracana subsp. coracana]GJM97673.1 hypothetical protein PR202_ga14615 [Eleusine coracana subsp. coracana]
MDRRLRSPARRPAAPRADERQRGGSPHRFLRPGALAWLRDSRIVARSLRSAAAAAAAALPSSSSLPPPRSPAPASHGTADGVPCFLLGAAAARGMRYPLRKKLAAARSVVFLPPQQHEAVDVFMDGFAAASSDLVAAH